MGPSRDISTCQLSEFWNATRGLAWMHTKLLLTSTAIVMMARPRRLVVHGITHAVSHKGWLTGLGEISTPSGSAVAFVPVVASTLYVWITTHSLAKDNATVTLPRLGELVVADDDREPAQSCGRSVIASISARQCRGAASHRWAPVQRYRQPVPEPTAWSKSLVSAHSSPMWGHATLSPYGSRCWKKPSNAPSARMAPSLPRMLLRSRCTSARRGARSASASRGIVRVRI